MQEFKILFPNKTKNLPLDRKILQQSPRKQKIPQHWISGLIYFFYFILKDFGNTKTTYKNQHPSLVSFEDSQENNLKFDFEINPNYI